VQTPDKHCACGIHFAFWN